MRQHFLFTFVLALVAFGCSSSSEDPETTPAWERREVVLLPPWQAGCTSDHTPIVMVHGFLASGDTYANHVMRFVANGYCEDRIFVFDWDTMAGGRDVEKLHAFVDEVLAVTGASQIDLMGHSAGGGYGYSFLSDPARAAKVRKYVHIASGPQEGPPGPEDAPVPTLNLFSANDRIVSNEGIEGVENVDLEDDDHYQVATSAESFEAIYEFLHGEPPAVVEIAPDGDVVYIAGRAVALGSNVPAAGSRVEIYELDPETAERTTKKPLAWFTADAQGYWGPYEGARGVHYELVVRPDNGRAIHYYREPFVRTNTKVYLRTIPSRSGGLTDVLVSALRFDDGQPTSVVFLANRGLQPGDALAIDEVDLSGDEFTNPDSTTIALFFYDANRNDETDGTPIGLFASFPFLSGVDFAPGVGSDRPVVVTWNEKRLVLPRRPGSEGVGIVVFE